MEFCFSEEHYPTLWGWLTPQLEGEVDAGIEPGSPRAVFGRPGPYGNVVWAGKRSARSELGEAHRSLHALPKEA
ncbi:MAG: hypothetical protein ACOH1V_14815 [Stenotrophomonas sp.]